MDVGLTAGVGWLDFVTDLALLSRALRRSLLGNFQSTSECTWIMAWLLLVSVTLVTTGLRQMYVVMRWWLG